MDHLGSLRFLALALCNIRRDTRKTNKAVKVMSTELEEVAAAGKDPFQVA